MISVRTKTGYSLLETVIYIGLIGIMLAISASSIIFMYRTFGILRVERAISLNGDIAMETMIRDIRTATSTNVSVSVFRQDPGILKVGTTTFSVVDAVLWRQTDMNPAQAVTGNNVRVSNLIFYRDASETSEIIGIHMTVAAGSGLFARQKQYYGSAVLRGSYK